MSDSNISTVLKEPPAPETAGQKNGAPQNVFDIWEHKLNLGLTKDELRALRAGQIRARASLGDCKKAGDVLRPGRAGAGAVAEGDAVAAAGGNVPAVKRGRGLAAQSGSR